MPPPRTIWLVMLCFFAIVNINSTMAQLTPNGIIYFLGSVELNANQESRLEQLKKSTNLKNHSLIKIQELASTQQEGVLKIEIPLSGVCENLFFTAKNVQYTSENDYYWYGTIESLNLSTPCNGSALTLMSKNGEHFGQLLLYERSFQVTDLGGGIQVLSEENRTADANYIDAGGVKEPVELPTGEPTYEEYIRNCSIGKGKVRVLVLFTPKAETTVGVRITPIAQLSVAQTNQALINSGFNTQDLEFELVGVERLDFKQSDNPSFDLSNLKNLDAAKKRREELRADIVVLLAEAYISTTNTTYGIAYLATDIANSRDYGYAIVDVNNASSDRFTFAHEVGHIFGADHDDAVGKYARGHIVESYVTQRVKFPTLLVSGRNSNGSRIQYYSNPMLNF